MYEVCHQHSYEDVFQNYMEVACINRSIKVKPHETEGISLGIAVFLDGGGNENEAHML